MKYSTWIRWWPLLAVRMHLLVVVSVVALALLGRTPDSVGGWESHPPAVYTICAGSRGGCRRGTGASGRSCQWRRGWHYIALTWPLPVWRGLLLGGIWLVSGQGFPLGLVGLPVVVWMSRVLAMAMPFPRRCPEWVVWLRWAGWVERWTLRLALGWALLDAWLSFGQGAFAEKGVELGQVESWAVVGSCLGCCAPSVTASYDRANHCYRAEIKGEFSLTLSDDDPFRVRLLVLFLRLLEWSGEQRGGRRTRDGRTPFVRQQELGRALGIVQPDLSRWEGYWTSGNWRRLLSQRAEEVLTLELQQRIIGAWSHLPAWGVEAVHRLLVEQGVHVTESQVRQAGCESGFQAVRGVLSRQWAEQAGELRLRDGHLVGELLRQIEFLLGKVEAGERLTGEERLDLAAWRKGMAAVGLEAPPPTKPLPWLMRVEQVVFGQWEAVVDGGVRCIYCGSRQVVRKSRRPRYKLYLDVRGELQRVPVYRYYCRNRQCAKGSFTDLPPGLVPYSRHRTELHLLALQGYAWSYSNYRRVGAGLGVAGQTAYRWVSQWGGSLLPMAELFGVVRSSGVVGVDEKYVLVPKNDKPATKMRRWMYVYFAVDAYTYDLLHIALYPHNDQESAQAFLLALRAKGYHPRVVVTDLRQDYGPVLARVFPKAEHHECIFHALQNVQQYVKEAYGRNYVETHPEAELLKQRIYAIFDAKTKRTAHKRYGEVLALREEYVEAAVLFDFLERHWPKLVNAIESDLIPTTNNTVELVIRRFDQHYQNFCGFDHLQSAALFLGVFEKLYRFTPFSQDAQPAIRGKSPLQLAGYDISQLPMASLCSGSSIIWPTEVCHVPNS
jgi:transposase-like protein